MNLIHLTLALHVKCSFVLVFKRIQYNWPVCPMEHGMLIPSTTQAILPTQARPTKDYSMEKEDGEPRRHSDSQGLQTLGLRGNYLIKGHLENRNTEGPRGAPQLARHHLPEEPHFVFTALSTTVGELKTLLKTTTWAQSCSCTDWKNKEISWPYNHIQGTLLTTTIHLHLSHLIHSPLILQQSTVFV